jgi:hypothetical protein
MPPLAPLQRSGKANLGYEVRMNTTLWVRFLALPVIVVGLLSVFELGQPSSGGFWGFLTRVSAALVAYGLGSVVPYILSEEFTYTRISTLDVNGGERIVRLRRMKEKDFQRTKANAFLFFAFGLVCWVANQFLPGRPTVLQYPRFTQFFWLSGPIYCLFAGFLYVSMRKGIETNPDLTSERAQIVEAANHNNIRPESRPNITSETERDLTKGTK